MALYHQPQPAYSGHHPMPPHGNYYHSPPQPPPPTMGYSGAFAYAPPPPDPSMFRRDYSARLSELTMNSRPIIQHLSMIAQDILRHSNPLYPEIVAQCLRAHIAQVPPWLKLPAFYVLDAISKNVHNPYATKFAEFVVPLFLDAFRLVDQQTKSKMEEMLVTWRTGSPTGKELFGLASQLTLERSVWGGGDPSSSTSSRRPQQPQPITRSQVLAELEVTLAQKERAASLNPSDSAVKNQAAVLYQLRRLVEQGVSQEELSQILQQLRAMHQDASPPPPPPQALPPPPAPQPPFYPYQQSPPPGAFGSYGQPTHPAPPVPAYGQSNVPSSSSTPIMGIPASTTSSAPPAGNITDLFKNLVKAGLVSSTASGSNTPVHPGSISQDVTSDKGDEKTLEMDALESKRRYAKKVLSAKIKLTSNDIVKQRPQLIDTLYKDLPVQCKQCARRFPDGATGKKSLQDHLDEHFRINKRLKDSKESGTGRGHARGWFISIDDFINDVGNNERDRKGKGKATANSHVLGDAADDSRKRKRDGEPDSDDVTSDDYGDRASYVVVPAGEETKSIRCPVCKEAIRSEFWEEEEEWVWRGAVKVKEKIFHTTCHREMLASAAVAARLRLESGGGSGSRAGTPDVGISKAARTPTPERLLKRKAEVDDAERREETPPSKKVAIAIAA